MVVAIGMPAVFARAMANERLAVVRRRDMVEEVDDRKDARWVDMGRLSSVVGKSWMMEEKENEGKKE